MLSIFFNNVKFLTMKKLNILTLFTIALVCSSTLFSQDVKILEKSIGNTTDFKKSYFSTGYEGMIFSSSIFERPGKASHLSTLRFTMFFHVGTMYNYNFNKSVGIMSGLSIKNIGFIDKYQELDSTVKRRIYSLNLPVALKLGKMDSKQFFFIGAEGSLALNYKEKGYVKRNHKTKFNEWFSDRTPLIMPNVFLGYQRKSLYLKLSYYPMNFLNPDFVDKNNVKPYEGYKVNLFAFTIGTNVVSRMFNKKAH